MDGWRDLLTVSVRVDPDGAPTELRTRIKPIFPQIELELLREAEIHFGIWLVWEDRWMPDEDQWVRPIDLTANQPSHRLIFAADGSDTRDERLLLADLDEDGTGPSWEKHEWYAKSHENGGAWSRTTTGWLCRGLLTPGGAPGTVFVEALNGDRPVSKRRNR